MYDHCKRCLWLSSFRLHSPLVFDFSLMVGVLNARFRGCFFRCAVVCLNFESSTFLILSVLRTVWVSVGKA